MATRYLHYQLCFASKEGGVYGINFYKEADSQPTVIQLTGAASPFTTSENSGEDAYTPVRYQTGYIRLLIRKGEDDGLLEELLPATNTELMVRVYRGSYSGTWPEGTFTPADTPIWQGFVQSKLFTQAWTDYISMIELPVVSMLGALDDIYFPQGAARLLPLREIVTMAVDSLYDQERVITQVAIKSSWIRAYNIFWQVYLHYVNMQEPVTYISTLNVKTTIYEGKSYLEVLEAIAKLFNVTIREFGQILYFENLTTKDTGAGLLFSIDAFDESTPSGSALTFGSAALTDMQFMGTANRQTLIQGKKSARVTLQLEKTEVNVLALPESVEDETATTTTDITDGENASQLIVQMPARPSDSYVDYYFRLHNEITRGTGDLKPCPVYTQYGETITPIYEGSTTDRIVIYDEDLGEWAEIEATDKTACWYNNVDYIFNGECWVYLSDYPSVEEQFLNTTIFNATKNFPDFFPYSMETFSVPYPPSPALTWIRYGAIPIRFWIGTSEEEVNLKHGVYFNLDSTIADQLGLRSRLSYSEAGDYINFNFGVHLISQSHPYTRQYDADEQLYIEWDLDNWDFNTHKGLETVTVLYFKLRYGTKWWNGSAWQDDETTFSLSFTGETFPENWSQALEVTDVGGYYVPIDDTLSGDIEFRFCGTNTHVEYNSGETPGGEPHAMIVENFSCQILRKTDTTASTVEENNYYNTIKSKGASGEKAIELSFGTDCNNANEAVNLILDSNNTRISEITYNDGTSQRPEQHLLADISAYHAKTRFMYTAILQRYYTSEVNWAETMITYNGKTFFGIVKKHDWKQGQEEVNLIEINE